MIRQNHTASPGSISTSGNASPVEQSCSRTGLVPPVAPIVRTEAGCGEAAESSVSSVSLWYSGDLPDAILEAVQCLIVQLEKLSEWERFRSSCFVMSGLAAKWFAGLGHHVELVPCYVVAHRGNEVFLLGYRHGSVASNQVDGHCICVVDHHYVVDLGLANIQRFGWPEFPGGVVAPVPFSELFPHDCSFANGRSVQWRTDWLDPRAFAFLKEHEFVVEALYRQLVAATDNQSMSVEYPYLQASVRGPTLKA